MHLSMRQHFPKLTNIQQTQTDFPTQDKPIMVLVFIL